MNDQIASTGRVSAASEGARLDRTLELDEPHLRQEVIGKRERFLILGKEAGDRTENLRRVLEPLGFVEVVVDRPPPESPGPGAGAGAGPIYLSDEVAGGFGGMMSTSGLFPRVTAWSRALCHLSRTLQDTGAVWFVEDDVAGDAASFAALVRETVALDADLVALDVRIKEGDAHWPHWSYADGLFNSAARSFQPLCRLSRRLVESVLAFHEKQGRCTFHEVMFPSVARESGMNWKSWCREPAFKNLLGDFRFRPAVTRVVHGVSHPVKDAAVHEAICSLPPAEFPRIRRANLEGWSIFAEDYAFLVRHCRRMGIRRVVEFGPGDSTLAFLDAGCEVVAFEHDSGWLAKATERFAGDPGIRLLHCPEGDLPEEGSVEFEPDFVFVDGPPFREGQEMSRLQPSEWALRKCGCFLLHDAKRSGEMATLAEMERRGMHVTRIPTRKGLAIVVDPARRPEVIHELAGQGLGIDPSKGPEGGALDDIYAWSLLFGSSQGPIRALETGSTDGSSANLMLNVLFPHPESEVHCIDHYEGEAGSETRRSFESNAQRFGHASQFHLYEGLSREVLAWMIAGDGFWGSFDFIHLRYRDFAKDLLADACQAWDLLKPGGVLILDPESGGAKNAGRKSPRAAIDAFLAVYGEHCMRILDGNHLAVQKF